MANFPNTFIDAPSFLQPADLTDIDPLAAEALQDLNNRGYGVQTGVLRSDVQSLQNISSQEGTLEFCPNDIKKRWNGEEMTEAQLGKDGGRGVNILKYMASGDAAGFGWTGKSSTEERGFLPDCETTFAMRISDSFQGIGLAKPFSRITAAGSVAMYGADKVGLETWASNTAAVRAYIGAGALLVTTQDAIRPTRVKEQQDENGQRRDVRLYMKYPQTF